MKNTDKNVVFWSKKLKKYVTLTMERWKQLQKIAKGAAALLLLAGIAAAQSPIQAPAGVKTQTNVAAVTLSGQVVGHTNLVGVSFCENSCATNPTGDVLTVTTSNNDTCVSLVSSITANEAGSIWSCPVSAASTTITATVTGFKTFVHTALSPSEWATLPREFALAVGGACSPALGYAVINPSNGSAITLSGSGTPACQVAPIGGVIYANIGPKPIIDSLTFGVQLANCTLCDGTDYSALASASIYQGASFSLSTPNVSGPDSPICSGTLNANATASCLGGVNVAPAMVAIDISVTDPIGKLMFPTFTFSVPSLILTGGPGGNVKAILGFDATTGKPRAGQVFTQ
jgi:hypothetical protein